MLTIGLTGPTGSGKTTVLNILEELGCVCVDCDELYHEMLDHSPTLTRELTDRFGWGILNHQGKVDTKALAPIVFGDAQALADLNAIAHRHVVTACQERLQEAREAGEKGVVLDAISLIESGLGDLCDVTVAVTAPEALRLERIMARDGLTREQAGQRIAAQKPDEYYVNLCDHGITNDESKSFQELREEVSRLFADKLC